VSTALANAALANVVAWGMVAVISLKARRSS